MPHRVSLGVVRQPGRNIDLTPKTIPPEVFDKRAVERGPGRYTVAVKVVDIFGNDTMPLVRVTVG